MGLHSRTHLYKAAAFVFTLCLLITVSCKDDDDLTPVTVDFSTSSETVSESLGIKTVTLTLGDPAVKDGTLAIATTGSTSAVTVPSSINITQGQTSAQFAITIVNNAAIDGDKVVTITLSDPSAGFELGAKTTLTLTITDDEGVTKANFAVATSAVAENLAAGITISVPLSTPADAIGTVTVSYTPTDAALTTEPAAVAGKITIPVAVDATKADFKVIPVNGTNDNPDLVVTFTISEATGGVAKGTVLTHTLTITNDDNLQVTTVAAVRALYTSTDVSVTSDVFVKAIVTSIGGTTPSVHPNSAYVQDASGAILLYFSAAHSFTRGDEIQVNLKGGTIKSYQNLLEVDAVPIANATKLGTGTVPTPQVITITQFLTGDYESKLVKINGVSFPDADGAIKLTGTTTLSDGTKTMSVFTRTGASFADGIVPLGSGSVTGIASDFTSGPQLLPQVAADIFTSNPSGSIAITQSLVNFGSVNNGLLSATSQSYTVQGTGLTADLKVTASGGFKIATADAGPYESEIVIAAANANALNTIYVKFAPITGVNQAITGTITHKSQGALNQKIDVAGTEAGNGASNLLLNENFNYSPGQLTSIASGANVSGGNWVNFSGTSNVLNVVAGNLSYTGYVANSGNKVSMINGSAEDAYAALTSPVTTGKVYVAFLVNVTSATGLIANSNTAGDYFAGFLPSSSVTALDARLSIRAGVAASTYNFGLRATSGNATSVFKSTDYALNQTHLIVISYEIVAGATNDVMRVWIDPSTTGAEPTEDLTQTGAAADLADIARIYLRQGTNAVNADVDGFRAATTWTNLFN